MTTSKLIRHDSCEDCGSSDGKAVYDDHTYCFVCQTRHWLDDKKGGRPIEKTKKDRPLTPLSENPRAMKSRGINSTSVSKYKVLINVNPESNVEAVFPLFDADGRHVANQVRYQDKDFRVEGDLKAAGLFGRQAFPQGGKSITVTEGYYDALSAFQLTGSRYPNVGVMSASSAKKEVVDDFEYLNSFQNIIINFDSDEPGQKAAKEVAALFEPGKVRILKLEKAKDANDYLKEGLTQEYVREWFNAPTFMPDGLQLGSDPALIEEIISYVDPVSIPYPWSGLNRVLYGLRTSELVLITADTGVGKTSFIKEIQYSLLMNPDLIEEGAGVGFLHFEEPKRKTALGLMSIHNNKPYHFPDVERTEEELREAYKAVLDTSRVVIHDHFGSSDIDHVLAKIRHMAALGCRYIFVDHLSIIVSDQSGDERKQLDEISTKIKTLTMQLDICCTCVIHINRQGQVRGSAGPEQVANSVIRLERNKKEANEWRRNVTKVSVEKNREFGRTGPATYLFFNEITGRLEELDDEMVQRYEEGGADTGHEFDRYQA